MQSIVSYPVRGEGGNARWRGNVAPQLIEDRIDQFHPISVADSNTLFITSRERIYTYDVTTN